MTYTPGFGDISTWGGLYRNPDDEPDRCDAVASLAESYLRDPERIDELLGDVACSTKQRRDYHAALLSLLASNEPLADLIRRQADTRAEDEIEEAEDDQEGF